MSTSVETLDSLQEALDPLSALRSEQDELGSWIHDSFNALEKLHAELTQWQSELARKETELDLRQDALSRAPACEKGSQKQAGQVDEQLAKAKEEIQRLEQENDGQRQKSQSLATRAGELEVQCGVAQKQITELETALAAERERSAAEREMWREEFQKLRDDLEKYHQTISEQLEMVAASQRGGQGSHTPLSAGAAQAKNAELRRRAQSRREAKARNHSADPSQK